MKTIAALLFAAAVYLACWRLGERNPLWIPGVVVIAVGLAGWMGVLR